MSELIDRKAAIKAIDALPNCYNGFSDTYDKSYIIGVLEELPTIDAVPVVHGAWIFNPADGIEAMFTKPKCSLCGFESSDGLNYCPNCGAMMEPPKEE